jgi:hypothetical protein
VAASTLDRMGTRGISMVPSALVSVLYIMPRLNLRPSSPYPDLECHWHGHLR